MSHPGKPSISAGTNPLISELGVRGGEAAGSQAQFSAYLQLVTQGVAALQGLAYPVFKTYTFTAAGNLTVSSTFPNVTAGTIIINPATLATMTVTLPGGGGPWIVLDGTGQCAVGKTITTSIAGGATINGAATMVFNTAYASKLLIPSGGNYITLG